MTVQPGFVSDLVETQSVGFLTHQLISFFNEYLHHRFIAETISAVLDAAGFRNVRKACPCNEYPLKPNFYMYILKLGNAGVSLFFFLFVLQNIDCGYSLERVPTVYVLSENK